MLNHLNWQLYKLFLKNETKGKNLEAQFKPQKRNMMKNLFKNILVLAVMLGTYTSYANETLEVATTFKHVKKGQQIAVSDASGDLIYSGTINYNGNLTTLFDFTQLKDGKYTVEITKDFVIEIYSIEVKDNLVSYSNSSDVKIYKPVFRTKADMVIISKLALTSSQMTVELYYENELIHTEIVKGNEVLNRVYKLDRTLNGNYTAIVKSEGRVFVENFKI